MNAGKESTAPCHPVRITFFRHGGCASQGPSTEGESPGCVRSGEDSRQGISLTGSWIGSPSQGFSASELEQETQEAGGQEVWSTIE